MLLNSSQAAGLHTVFETLSFFVGYAYYRRLRKMEGDSLSEDTRIYIIIGAAAGALLFSRLIGLLEDPALFSGPHDWAYYFQHKTIVGGLAGGLLGVEITKKIIGEKRSSGDLFVFPLIMALIVGRIGCFLAGTWDGTAGTETDFFLGMDLGDGVKRHPTSLYEIAYLIALFGVLKKISRLQKPSGHLFAYFMIAYAGFRLLIEELKPIHPLFIFSAIQWTCLLILIYYSRLIYENRRASKN